MKKKLIIIKKKNMSQQQKLIKNKINNQRVNKIRMEINRHIGLVKIKDAVNLLL